MREQIIAQKVGNRSGISGQRRSGAVTQKPARRESSGQTFSARLRALLAYLPSFLKLALAIVIGVLVFAGYRAAASASFFELRTIEVQGTSRLQPADIQALVKQAVGKTGVWNADLNGINDRLERLPWVRTAVVSRVLPDGIRVRITERSPRAVVRTSAGRFRWVDEDAVLLGEMQPTDQMPAFFLYGLSDEDSESARSENRERVAKFLELQQAWDAAGISDRVSEVNLMDIRDVRAQLAGDNSQIEVRLGARDQAARLKGALKALDSRDDVPNRAMISYIDMSLGNGKAIVGLTSGVHTTTEGNEAPAVAPETASLEPPAPVDKKAADKPASATSHVKANVDERTVTDKNKNDRNDRNKKTDKKSEKSQTAARHKQ
ncbi:MAG TPA: FtsQ-type POTRA domain-containing protein [Pyrinomonadaceae bacterium]|jgi:cell division protein FtsQ|nr:FtsQ-type POTRA domain-containing protein [Pyrinomonadaceae bacterium]